MKYGEVKKEDARHQTHHTEQQGFWRQRGSHHRHAPHKHNLHTGNVSVRSINPCTSLTGKQMSGIEMTSSAWHRWIQKWQGCGLCILQVSQKPGWSTLRELGWEYWPRRPEVHKNARGFWSVQNLRYLLSLLHLPAQLTLHPSHLFHTLYYIDCREM